MLQITFKIKHDAGKFTLMVIADNLDNAIDMVCKSENCPKSALELKSIVPQLYKVFKVGRISQRRQIIRKNLSLQDAQSLVNRYPDSNRSMVCYTRQ